MTSKGHLRPGIAILASIAAFTCAGVFAAEGYPTRPIRMIAGFDANNWYGIVVPARTLRAIIDQLNAEVTKILNMPEVRTTLLNQGLDPALD